MALSLEMEEEPERDLKRLEPVGCHLDSRDTYHFQVSFLDVVLA